MTVQPGLWCRSQLALVWTLAAVSFSLLWAVGLVKGVRRQAVFTGGRPSAGLCPLPVGVVYRLAAGDPDTHTAAAAGACERHGGGVMMWM